LAPIVLSTQQKCSGDSRIAVMVKHVEFPSSNMVCWCFITFLLAPNDILTLGITYPIYLQLEDLASVWTVLMLIDKSKMLRAYQLQTWRFSALAQIPR
jgi:hypothetical protein